jgi:hypothetical protein
MTETEMLRELAETARSIANRAPKRQGDGVFSAQIPWSLIHGLRSQLDTLGYEWRK